MRFRGDHGREGRRKRLEPQDGGIAVRPSGSGPYQELTVRGPVICRLEERWEEDWRTETGKPPGRPGWRAVGPGRTLRAGPRRSVGLQTSEEKVASVASSAQSGNWFPF